MTSLRTPASTVEPHRARRSSALLARIGLVGSALLLWTLFSSAAFAWSPLIVTSDCSEDGLQLVWTVKASHGESDLGVQFATNPQFSSYSSYTLNSSSLSVEVTTSTSVTQVWVRWSNDHNVVTSAYSQVCDTPSPTPSDTPSPTPSDTPSPTPSDTPSPTPSDTPSPTPSDTPSPTPSDTPSPTPSDTPSPTPSDTPSPTPSDTPSPTPSDTASPTPSDTPSPTPTLPDTGVAITGTGSSGPTTGLGISLGLIVSLGIGLVLVATRRPRRPRHAVAQTVNGPWSTNPSRWRR